MTIHEVKCKGGVGGVALGLDITNRIANALLSLWLLQSYFADEIVRHKIKKRFLSKYQPCILSSTLETKHLFLSLVLFRNLISYIF